MWVGAFGLRLAFASAVSLALGLWFGVEVAVVTRLVWPAPARCNQRGLWVDLRWT